MRIIFSLAVALLLAGGWGVSQAKADVCGSVSGNLVKNCGFETIGAASIPDWTASGNQEGGYNGNYWGVDNSNPNSGTYEGYFGVQGSILGQVGPALHLSQGVSAPQGFYYRITFYLDQNGPTNAPGYTNFFSAFFDGLQLMSETNAPNSGGYEKFSFLEESDGASPTLSFSFQNDDDVFFLDDVSVQKLGPTPEPASLLLVAPILGAFWLLRGRRSAA